MSIFNNVKLGRKDTYSNNEEVCNDVKNKNALLFSVSPDDDIDKSMLYTLMSLDNLNNKDVPKNLWGQRFELFLADLFSIAGYRVEKVSDAGKSDNGIDLIIEKDGERIAVQAKNYKLTGTYSVDKTSVQNFVGAIETRKDITAGVIITTQFFTENAVELCNNLSPENKKVKLVNREELCLLIAKIYPELIAKAFFEKETQSFPRCPQCGSITIKKKFNKDTHENFYGCIHFPNCRGYVSIKDN